MLCKSLKTRAAHLDGSEALDLVCNLDAAGNAHGARLLCTALLKRKLQNVEKDSTWEVIVLWSQLTRRAWPSEPSRFLSACLELGSVARTTCHLLFLIRTIQAEMPSDGLETCVQLCIRGLRLQAEDGCESATEEPVSAMVSLCLTLACLMPDDAEVGRACLLTHFFEDVSVITYRALEQASCNSEAKPTCSGSLPPSMRCELLLLLKARWPFDPELWDWTSLRQQCLNMLPSEETAKLVPAEGDSAKEERTSPGVEEQEEEEDKEKKDQGDVKMPSDDGRISWREALAATNLMPGYTINAQHQHHQGGTGIAASKQHMQQSLINRPQINSVRIKHRCRLCRRDVGSVRIVRHARKHFVTGQPGCPLCPKRFSNIEEATWHVRLHLRRARKAALSRTAQEKQTKSSHMIHRLFERPRKNPKDKDWTPSLAVPFHRESDGSSESDPSSSSGSPQLARPSLHRKVKKNQLYGADFVTFSDDGTSDVDDSSDAFFPPDRQRVNGINVTATEVLVDYFGPTIGCDGFLRRHPCPSLQCDKAFKMFKTLVAHVRTVHATNTNVQLAMDALQAGRRRCCRYCRRKFGSTVHLHDHLFISHSGPAPYGCPQMDCSLRFESNEELVRHTAAHFKYCGQCAFPGCGEIFGRKQLLYRHEASHYEVHVPGETSEGTETSSPPSPQRPRGRPSLRGHPPSTRGKIRSLTNTSRTPKTPIAQIRKSKKLQKPLKKLFCGIDSCFSTFNWPQSLHRHLETMHGRQGLPLVRSRHVVPEALHGSPSSSLSQSIMESIKNPPKPTLPAQNSDISTILMNPSPDIERSESQRQPRGRRGRGRGRHYKDREPTTGCIHDWEAQWPAIMQDGKFVCTHCSMVYESGKRLGGRITTKRKAEGPLEHLGLTENEPSNAAILVKSGKGEKGVSLPYALQNATSSGDTKVDITTNCHKVEIAETMQDKAGDMAPQIRHAPNGRPVDDCIAGFSNENVASEIGAAIKEPNKTNSLTCVETSFVNDVPQVPFSQAILPGQRFETTPFTKMLAFDTPSQHSTHLNPPEWKCSRSSGSYRPCGDTNTHTAHIPTTEPYHASLNSNIEPPAHPYEPNFGETVQTLFPSSEPPIASYDGLNSNLTLPAQSPHIVSTQDPPSSSSYPYCAPSYNNSVPNTHLPLQSVSFQYQQSQSMQKATGNNSDSCSKDPSSLSNDAIHTKCTESGNLPLRFPNESLVEHSSSFAADLQPDGTSCESNIFGEISVSEILETVRQMDLENSEAHGDDDDRDGVDWTSSDNPYNSLYWGTGSDSNDDSHCNLGMDDLFGAFSEAQEDTSGTDSKCNKDTSTPRKHKSAKHRKHATNVNMKVSIRPFICHLEGCKYNALTRSALVNHYMKTHDYSRDDVGNLTHCKSTFTPFHCFLTPCTKAFTRNSNLRSHYRSVHKIEGQELDKLCSESLKSIATNLSSPIKQEVISHVSYTEKQESPTSTLGTYGQKVLGELISEDTSQTGTRLLPSSFSMLGRQPGPVDQVAPSVATETDCNGQIHPASHPSFSPPLSSLAPFDNQDDLANPNVPDSVRKQLSKAVKVRLQAAGNPSEAECSTSREIPPVLKAESHVPVTQVMQECKMLVTSMKLENDDVLQLNGNTCDKPTRFYTCNMIKCSQYFAKFGKLIDHYRDYHNLSSDEVQHYISPDDADEFLEQLNTLGSFTCYSNLSRHEHVQRFSSVESPQKQSPPGFQVMSNAASCLSGESSVPQPLENSSIPLPTPEDNSHVTSPAGVFAEPAGKNDLSKPIQTCMRGTGVPVNSKNKRLNKKTPGLRAHLSKASTTEESTSPFIKYVCDLQNCSGEFNTLAKLRRHMRRKHDLSVDKTSQKQMKQIKQIVRGESGEWIYLCNGTKVTDCSTKADELPPSILKSNEDALQICKYSGHLKKTHACMLISCCGVLSSSYSLIRHYRRVHRMPAAYIELHLSSLVLHRQHPDPKRHRASADASPSSGKPMDHDHVQNWRSNYDFKAGSMTNHNPDHDSSADCKPVLNSLLNPDPMLVSQFDLGIMPDSPVHQDTAPASALEPEAASASALEPEAASAYPLKQEDAPTSMDPGTVLTSTFNPGLTSTSTLEPGVATTSTLDRDDVATSVLEKDAALASALEADDATGSPLEQHTVPDSSLENDMELTSLLKCRSRQQSTFISRRQHNSMLDDNEKHPSLSRGPALASLLKSNHTFVSPVNKGHELSSVHPLQTLPTSVNHSPNYSNTKQLPHDHNCSLATTIGPSRSSPSHLCRSQALARHLCPGRASAGQLCRGRASAGQLCRGRASAGQLCRGRASAGQLCHGRASAGQLCRGRASAGQLCRGRASAGQLCRGRASAGQLCRGRASAGQLCRGRASAGQLCRGRASAGQLCRGRASAGQLCRGRATAGQLCRGRASAGQLCRGRASAGQLCRGRASAGQFERDQASAGQFERSRTLKGKFCRSSETPNQMCRGRTSPNHVLHSGPSSSHLFHGLSPSSKVFHGHGKSSPTCASTEFGHFYPEPDSSGLSSDDHIHSAALHRITATQNPPGITCSPSPPPSSDPSMSAMPASNPSPSAPLSHDTFLSGPQRSDTSPSAAPDSDHSLSDCMGSDSSTSALWGNDPSLSAPWGSDPYLSPPLGSEPFLSALPCSDPSLLSPPNSDPSSFAPLDNYPSSSAPGSDASLSAPQGSDASLSAPHGSDASLSAPQRSDSSLSAPQRSDSSLSAPQRSDTSPTADPGSDPSPWAPRGSDPSSSAPLYSNSSLLAPPGSNLSPSSPLGSTPYTLGSDSSRLAPQASDPTWLIPLGSDSQSIRPCSNPFPLAPTSSNPFLSAPPGNEPSHSQLPRSYPSISATEGSDLSPSALLGSNPSLALLGSCSSLSVSVGTCLSPFGLPCNTHFPSAPPITTLSPSASRTTCSLSAPLSITHTPLALLSIVRSPSAPPSIGSSPVAPPSNAHSTVAPLSSALSPSAPSHSACLPSVSMCSTLSPSVPPHGVYSLSALAHGTRSMSAPPCSAPCQTILPNACFPLAPPHSIPDPLAPLNCKSAPSFAHFLSTPPSSTKAPSAPPSSTKSPSAPPSGTKSPSAPPSGTKSPSAPPSGTKSPSAPPSSTKSPSAPPSSTKSPSAPPSSTKSPSAPPSSTKSPSAPPSSTKPPSAPPSSTKAPSAPPSSTKSPSAPPSSTKSPSAPPSSTKSPSAPPSSTKSPSAPPSSTSSLSAPPSIARSLSAPLSIAHSLSATSSCARSPSAPLSSTLSLSAPLSSTLSLSAPLSSTLSLSAPPSITSSPSAPPSSAISHLAPQGRGQANTAPSCHSHTPSTASFHGLSSSAASFRHHTQSDVLCRDHLSSASLCNSRTPIAASFHSHSPSVSSFRGPVPSSVSCRDHRASPPTCRSVAPNPAPGRSVAQPVTSCHGHTLSAASFRGHAPSHSSSHSNAQSATSYHTHATVASSCRRQSSTPSSCRSHIPSTSPCRGHSLSASTCHGHSPSVSSCRGHSPSASSCRGQSPSPSSYRGQLHSAFSFRGRSPSASSCRGQSPSASSCRGQSPSASSCRRQSPSASSCRGQSPSASSCRGQSPSASSCRGQSPSASSCRGQSPSAASCRGQSPSASSCRGQSPSASSCRGQLSSASSCRGQSPSASSCHIPTHNVASHSGHTSSHAAQCRVPSPSVASFRGQVPSSSSCHGLSVSPPSCSTSSPSALSSRIHTRMAPPTSPFRIPAPPILPSRSQSLPMSSCSNRFPLPVSCHSHNPANPLSHEGSLVCPLKNCRVRTCPWSNHRVLPSSLDGGHASSSLLNCNTPIYSRNRRHFSTSRPDPALTSPSGPDPTRMSPSGPDPARTSPSGPDPTRTSPSGPDPARTSPSGPDPARTSPSGPVPARTSPSGPVPARTSPSGPVPARTSPSGPVPARTSPSGPVPARTSPSGPVPARTSPSGPVPARTSPSGPVPARTSLPGPVPARTSLSGPVPARTSPSGPVPARTSPSGPVPARMSPSGPVPARTSPFGPVPAPTSPSGPDPARTSPSDADLAWTSPSGPDPTRPLPLVHVPTQSSQLIHHHIPLSNGFDRTRFSHDASSSRKLSHLPRKRGRPRKTDVFESHRKPLVSDTSNASQPCRYEASFIHFLKGSYLARHSLSPSKWTPHHLRARSKGRRMSGRRVGHLALKSFANAISQQEEEAVVIEGGMNLRVVLERKLLDRKVHQLLALKPVVVLERLVLASEQ
uniref:uncharacterized protein isoform X2 n=1 Tax=Myxine glutinosa TaxID=7769 RepID=UPI00358FA420